MKSNPLLEEIREIRRQLEREAGGDLATLCAQTREWGATHPLPGPLVHPDDLPAYFARIEAEAAERAKEGAPIEESILR